MRYSSKNRLIGGLTYDDLLRSPNLRSIINDYDLAILQAEPTPQGSFERKFSDKRAEETAAD